jgi:hypothetical protein
MALVTAACSSSGSSGSTPASVSGSKAPAKCPLSGVKPTSKSLLTRPALAVKVENNPDAYPLSGIDKAEIVNEELVEGGLTRFMAIFDCTDADPVGPVRSSREIDPAIMEPTTRILGAAGGNAQVRKVLDKYHVDLIDEPHAGTAMFRRSRPGYSTEHTLYANTAKLRKLGEKKWKNPPPQGLYSFGPPPKGKFKKATHISLNFSQAEKIQYTYRGGKYLRSDYGSPLTMESGKQIAPNNVLIEEHTYDLSKITDIAGVHSTSIKDPTGKGTAVLFRDGRVYKGTWQRPSISAPVKFKLASGKEMTLHTGKTFIELLPNHKGQLKGSYSYSK